MSVKAVIDRFEEEWAILLMGEDERRVEVKRQELPDEASEGDWLLLEIEDDRIVSAVIDKTEKDTVSERIMSKLERLRRGEHLK